MTELYSKPKRVLRVRGFAKQFQTQTRITPKHALLGCVQMDNVFEFPNVKSLRETQKTGDPILEFIRDHLLPWALENGIDVSSMQFKLNGATIMTCLQGMLLDDEY